MIHQYTSKIKSSESKFVLVTMFFTLLVAFLSSIFKWGPISAFILAFGMYSVLCFYAFINEDKFLKALLIFGIAAGFAELLADLWLVTGINSLVYPINYPNLVVSPAYMPFAWSVILIQVGYLGWLISLKTSVIESVIVSFIIGMCFIPLFEHFAKKAGWWYYNPCKMIFNTPYYIILGEGLITLFLPIIFIKEMYLSNIKSAFLGILLGLWIFCAYFISFKIIE